MGVRETRSNNATNAYEMLRLLTTLVTSEEVGSGGGVFDHLNHQRGCATNETSTRSVAASAAAGEETGCFENQSAVHVMYDEDQPFHLDFTQSQVLVNGFVAPVIVFVTIVTNSLICLVLMDKSMRSPTNLLLVAMAISDVLTGLFPCPFYIYFYTMGNEDYVPYEWCFATMTLTLNIPTVFHTASVWLTVALAVQRYVYVCHPQKAKAMCTIPNTIKAIFVIYAVSLLSQMFRFFEYDYQEIQLTSLTTNRTMTGCLKILIPFLQRNMTAYFSVYWWIRVVFIHLVPCASLVIFNLLLYHVMRMAQAKHQLLLRQNRRSECRRLVETNAATMMLLTVVGVFLLVEFPMAVLMIVMIVENTFELYILEIETKDFVSFIINQFILFSYPVNFFIYCAMSRQFRQTFKRLFSCRSTSGGSDAGNEMDSNGQRRPQAVSYQTTKI